MKKIPQILFGVLLLAVTGCSGGDPYVVRPYEIDRDNRYFPLGPAEVAEGYEISVCYAKSAATPAVIREMADTECGRYDMKAVFVEQTYSVCPLAMPVAAVFQCVDGASVSAPAPGAPTMQAGPASPALTVPLPAGAGARGGFGSIGAADVSTSAKSQPFPTYLFNDGARPQ